MSNKSRGPGQRNSPNLQQFAENLGKAAERIQQRASETSEVDISDPTPAPQGQLPLPKTQTVGETTYQWTWEPILDSVIVKVTYFIKDDKWYVDIINADEGSWHPEDAKKIAESILAAWNWQYIWKDHFADFALQAARAPRAEKKVVEKDVPNTVTPPRVKTTSKPTPKPTPKPKYSGQPVTDDEVLNG